MREIKFRGYGKDKKQWIYGSLLDEKSVDIVAIQDGDCHVWEVDSESVGQYTGLLDSNGNEIYEGDIIRFAPPWRWEADERRIGVVVYKYFAFVVKYGDKSAGLFNLAANEDPYFVIGNMHDNPDLVEADNA